MSDPVSQVSTHWTSSYDMSRGMMSGSCSYSSKEDQSGSVRSGMRITRCFYLRTSMTDCPVLVYASPRNNTPLFPCPWIPLTAAHILPLTTFELRVLAYVSSLYWVVIVGCNWLSTTVSAQKSAYFQIP